MCPQHHKVGFRERFGLPVIGSKTAQQRLTCAYMIEDRLPKPHDKNNYMRCSRRRLGEGLERRKTDPSLAGQDFLAAHCPCVDCQPQLRTQGSTRRQSGIPLHCDQVSESGARKADRLIASIGLVVLPLVARSLRFLQSLVRDFPLRMVE